MTNDRTAAFLAARAAGAALLAGAVIALGCERSPSETGSGPSATAPPAGPPWFENVAAASGLDYTWESGHGQTEQLYMPESIGGGGALFDMDGDGDLDAYLVQAGVLTVPPEQRPPNLLLENQGDGTFRDVTEGSGADDRGYGMGAACADVDNDGDVDVYVTNLGPNVLLRNEGGGRFTDVTATAGVGNADWGSSAAFLDYDHDGDLDLFVLNYVNWSIETEIDCYNTSGHHDYCLPANYGAPGKHVLYRNEGDGTFTDVTDAAGMTGAVGSGLGVVCGDFVNGDGWPDIFVANDGMPDHLWVNRRDGSFIEFAMALGAALDQEGKAKAGMGVTAADIDDDRDLDLLVCNLEAESDSLFINEGQYFADSTIVSGLSAVSRRFTRFGLGWVDFDNDGYLDLYQANGRVQMGASPLAADPYAEPNLLFKGAAGPRFREVRPRGGTAEAMIDTSRAAIFGDVDNDGAIDVIVANRDSPAYLLRNTAPDRGHWIMVRAIDRHGRDAIGATLSLPLGERTISRDVRAAYSYLASNDMRVHFGLGDHAGPVDVTVSWPDGTEERFGGLEADRIHEVRYGGSDQATKRPSD